MDILLVGLGGFLGAIARYSIYLLQQMLIPSPRLWATLLINVVGSFIAGVVLSRGFSTPKALFLMMGVLGAFTTFSAFSVESMELYRAGRFGMLGFNVTANVVFGMLAVWLGLASAS